MPQGDNLNLYAKKSGFRSEVQHLPPMKVSNRTVTSDKWLGVGEDFSQDRQATGFQNEKSFIRAFKGWTGLAPSEWRTHG